MRDTQQEIIHFWFGELEPQQWFQSSPAVDAEILERFALTHEMADDGLCNHWAVDADGRKATQPPLLLRDPDRPPPQEFSERPFPCHRALP